MHRSITKLAAVAIACTLVLAACGGSEGSTGKPAGAAKASRGVASGEPTHGGTLEVGTFGESGSLDPARIATLGALDHPLMALYDTLLVMSDEGEVLPHIAEAMEANDDATQWVMTLREGVKFSDGSALDAEAVKANLLRHLDPEVKSASLNEVDDIQDMTVDSPLELTLDLKEPNSAFDVVFTTQVGMMMAPAALEPGYEVDSAPIGAGPFKFESWQRDNRMTLVKNEDYWQAGKPYLDRINFRPIPDGTTRLSSLRSSDIDVAVFIDDATFVAAEKEASLLTTTRRGNGGPIIVMNTERAPFDDQRVRRALAHAIDVDTLGQVLFAGEAVTANGPFSPDSPYYLEDNGYPEFDVEEAKRLIDEYVAETGNEVRFSMMLTSSPEPTKRAELLQGMWAAVGATLDIEPVDPADLVARMPQGDFDMVHRTLVDFFSPQPTLSRQYEGGSPGNVNRLVDPELDAAFAAGRAATTEEDRIAAYQEVSRRMGAEVTTLFTHHGITGSVHQKNVSLGDYFGLPSMHYADVAFTE